MSKFQEKIDQVDSLLKRFDQTFYERPEMLGSPVEVNAMFFYLDQIRFILDGKIDCFEFDKSWLGFLVEKKYIVGANDRLIDGLKSGEFGFDLLKKLRSEYFAWRAVRP